MARRHRQAPQAAVQQRRRRRQCGARAREWPNERTRARRHAARARNWQRAAFDLYAATSSRRRPPRCGFHYERCTLESSARVMRPPPRMRARAYDPRRRRRRRGQRRRLRSQLEAALAVTKNGGCRPPAAWPTGSRALGSTILALVRRTPPRQILRLTKQRARSRIFACVAGGRRRVAAALCPKGDEHRRAESARPVRACSRVSRSQVSRRRTRRSKQAIARCAQASERAGDARWRRHSEVKRRSSPRARLLAHAGKIFIASSPFDELNFTLRVRRGVGGGFKVARRLVTKTFKSSRPKSTLKKAELVVEKKANATAVQKK